MELNDSRSLRQLKGQNAIRLTMISNPPTRASDPQNWRRILSAVMVTAIPVVLLGFFVLLRSEFREVGELRTLVDNSVETHNDLREILSEHLDVETGQRGFVLTGRPEFLEPYQAGQRRIDSTFRTLKTHASTNPELNSGIERLQRLSQAMRTYSATTVDLARSTNPTANRARVEVDQGKRLMDALRAEIVRLDSSERAHLAVVTDSRDDSRNRIEVTIYFLLAGFALLLLLIGIVTRRAILERQRQFARADELAERQRAILNGTVDGLLVLDRDGYILETNASVQRLFGYDDAHLVGKHNTYLMETRPALADSIAWLKTVGESGREGAGKRMDFTGQRKDGTVFETDVAVSRIESQGGARYVAIIKDITERKRVEEMKTEFVSTVSHELRTPLTSIGGSLGLLAAGAVGPLSDKAVRLVQIAHSNCERLIRLINDILDIEKIESGNMLFDMRRMRVAPLLERVAAANAQFAAAHEVRLEIHCPAWPLTIEGDADRLDQVLTNLVSNAIKHSPQGASVEIVAQQNGALVRIEVRDRGAGVPNEFRSRIFGKFAMADGSDNRTRGGTGLGLAIVQEIVQRHGGRVGFIDRAGGGTVFHVDLPIICDDVAPSRASRSDLPSVLHIDDDQDCLDVVASAFEGRAEVVSAVNLAQARSAVAQHNFAAALIDIGLHPENGLELVPHLRAAIPRAPVILFTAFDGVSAETSVDAVLIKSRTSVEALVETTLRLIRAASRMDVA